MGDLFRQHHFTVRLNAGTARPRQTDVLVSRAAETYLVECKWRSDKADIDDIDSLRARLRRTDRLVIGLLVVPPDRGLGPGRRHRGDRRRVRTGPALTSSWWTSAGR